MTDRRRLIPGLLVIVFAPPLHAQAVFQPEVVPAAQTGEPTAKRFFMGAGYAYSAGRYGAENDTRLSSLPVTLGWSTNSWALQLGVAHLHRRGPAGTVVVPDGGFLSTAPAAAIESASGWGDTWVLGTRYYVLDQYRSGANLHLSAGVKLATGSRDKGLSTGEPDASVGAEVTRFWGRLETAVSAGYIIAGRAPGLALRNHASGRARLRWNASDALALGLTYHVGQRVASGVAPIRDATLSLDAAGPLGSRLSLHAQKGFSDGSADQGAGLWLTWPR